MKSSINQAKRKGPFRLLKSKRIYKNPWISVREDKVVRHDGKRGIFGIVKTMPGSSIVILDREGYCYLVKEYGYGKNITRLGLPGGAVEKNESPLVSAKRECAEETGMESTGWHNLGKVYFYTTVFDINEHLLLALDARRALRPRPEEDQKFTKIVRLPFARVVKMVFTGKIRCAEHIVAILRADNYLRSRKYVFKKGGD